MTVFPRHKSLTRSDIYFLILEWKINGRPRQSGIDWDLKTWVRSFPQYQEKLEELKKCNFGFLDRKEVKKQVQEAIQTDDLVYAFLIVLIWGFGDRGYGQFRAKKLVDQKLISTALKKCNEELLRGNVDKAYLELVENGPDGLGCSFGSKFLYFAAPENFSPKPIILDQLVIQGIRKWGSYRRINPLSVRADQYLEIVNEFHAAAQFFGIQSEQLEEILFSREYLDRSGGSWSSERSNIENRLERLAWSIALASNLHRKGAFVEVERSHDGGGQYDSVNISISQSGKRELLLNTNGNVHIQPDGIHLTWETAMNLGLLRFTNRLLNSEDRNPRSMPSPTSFSYSWLARALLGEESLVIDNFESLLVLPDDDLLQFKKALEKKRDVNGNSQFPLNIAKNSLVLFNNHKVVGILLVHNAKVILTDGSIMDIEEDSYMPVENYYGDDLD